MSLCHLRSHRPKHRLSHTCQDSDTRTIETHTPAASSSFFLISENLCPCDHLALLLSSHLAGIRNHSLLAVDFNVSLLMTLVSSKILRYHARANCSYQWATIPDVNMHYFLHFSCFIEVFFFFPQAFIHYSHFFSHCYECRWYTKIYHIEVRCTIRKRNDDGDTFIIHITKEVF